MTGSLIKMMLAILDDIGDVGDADDIGKGCPNLQIMQFFNIVENNLDPPLFLNNVKKRTA